jgi:nicotinamide-nucleotide amidase
MKAEIIAVGSELLTARFQDTNSVFLMRRLEDLGLPVLRRTVVGDRLEDLVPTIDSARRRADLVLLSGGLGPTGDDVTREAMARALGRELVLEEAILRGLEERFARRGRIMSAPNRRQAFVVSGAAVLANRMGTAPGLWIEDNGIRFVLLPGPPHELEAVFEDHVWPRLAALRRGYGARRMLRTTGLTESDVEARIADLYPRTDDLRLTILASPGQIDLHVASFSERTEEEAAAQADRLASELAGCLEPAIYARTNDPLENIVAELLLAAGRSVATAESCTGGLLAHRLTNVSGSSAYFREGFVTYDNAAKIRELGVPAALIVAEGAVSAAVAEAMAHGVRSRAGSDFGLGLTGIAGPTGGTPDKPVGLVHIALAGPGPIISTGQIFFGRRADVKFQASQKALDLLRQALSSSA